VNMIARNTAAFPDHVMERLALMKVAHDKLPPPDGAGRRIGMKAAS